MELTGSLRFRKSKSRKPSQKPALCLQHNRESVGAPVVFKSISFSKAKKPLLHALSDFEKARTYLTKYSCTQRSPADVLRSSRVGKRTIKSMDELIPSRRKDEYLRVCKCKVKRMDFQTW